MTPEDIKQAVADGVKEGMTQHAQTDVNAKRTAFYIEPEQHYGDHGYIKGQRGAVKIVRTGSLYALGASVLGFIVWVLQSILNITPAAP